MPPQVQLLEPVESRMADWHLKYAIGRHLKHLGELSVHGYYERQHVECCARSPPAQARCHLGDGHVLRIAHHAAVRLLIPGIANELMIEQPHVAVRRLIRPEYRDDGPDLAAIRGHAKVLPARLG